MDFYIYVAPVSGGNFPVQLAFVEEISIARKQLNDHKKTKRDCAPDLSLVSSGGNIPIVAGMGGNWEPNGIRRNIANLNSTLFAQKWVPNNIKMIPEIFVAAIKGSMFRGGTGVESYIAEIFTEQTIKRNEIWMGTYDEENCKAQFSTNMGRGETIINPNFFIHEEFMYDTLPLNFFNGNLQDIANNIIGSTSIPGIVPKKEIKGIEYSDGGTMYSSPLTVFANEIVRIIENSEFTLPSHEIVETESAYILQDVIENKDAEVYTINSAQEWNLASNKIEAKPRRMRLFYLMSYQSNIFLKSSDGGLDQVVGAIHQLILVNCLEDRAAAINIIKRISKNPVIFSEHYNMNSDKLAKLLIFLDQFTHYVISLEPLGSPSISITNFNSADVNRVMDSVKENYTVHLWYSK